MKPGQTITDLEKAVAEIERDRAKILQVVGNFDGSWWLLVEKQRQNRETRSAE